MTPGSSITYQVGTIAGQFVPSTWQLQVMTPPVPSTTYPIQTITCFSTNAFTNGMANLYQEVTTVGTVCAASAPPDLSESLVEGWFAPTSNWYLGEYSNLGQTACNPGEAKMLMNPQGGEQIDIHSTVTSGGQVVSNNFHWTYQTIGHYAAWAGIPDCWWTCLVEWQANGHPNAVYNYVFARGIGMINFWWIRGLTQQPNGNWTGTGFEELAISHQGQ